MKTFLSILFILSAKSACIYAFVVHGLGITPVSWWIVAATMVVQAMLSHLAVEISKTP